MRSKRSSSSACPTPRLRPREPVVAGLVDEDLLGVDKAVEVDVLLGEAHQPPRLARVVVVAEHADLAGGRAHEVADRADQRRFPSAVRAEQAEERAVRDLEIEIADGGQPRTVRLRQTADRERGRSGGRAHTVVASASP